MSAKCCKHERLTGLLHRPREVIGWVLPVAVIALMPKCPVCIAGYIALATGFGVSVSIASGLRTGLLLSAVAVLLYFVFMNLSKLRRARP